MVMKLWILIQDLIKQKKESDWHPGRYGRYKKKEMKLWILMQDLIKQNIESDRHREVLIVENCNKSLLWKCLQGTFQGKLPGFKWI